MPRIIIGAPLLPRLILARAPSYACRLRLFAYRATPLRNSERREKRATTLACRARPAAQLYARPIVHARAASLAARTTSSGVAGCCAQLINKTSLSLYCGDDHRSCGDACAGKWANVCAHTRCGTAAPRTSGLNTLNTRAAFVRFGTSLGTMARKVGIPPAGGLSLGAIFLSCIFCLPGRTIPIHHRPATHYTTFAPAPLLLDGHSARSVTRRCTRTTRASPRARRAGHCAVTRFYLSSICAAARASHSSSTCCPRRRRKGARRGI